MTVTRKMNILDAIGDKDVFGSLPEFASLDTWKTWLVWLKATFAIPMDQGELAVYQQCTGRTVPPATPPSEVYSIIGRRGGKSYVSALVACYLAGFEEYEKYLHTGERLAILILARDRDQSKIVFNYISGILLAVPALRAKVIASRADEIELEGGVLILVKTSDYRAVRGLTVGLCVTDEISFWDSQGISPDKEVLGALRPSMATIPNSKLLVISTPYAKVGALFEAYRDHYAKDDDDRVLVWQADTRIMNPSITDEYIEREIARDPDGAQSEWLATFREDREAAFSIESLEACVIAGRGQLPSSPLIQYRAFCDPSGGRADSFGLAIGHAKDGTVIVDLIETWKPPFDPDEVTAEVAESLKRYGCLSVVGDRYASEWPISRFRAHGIAYEQCEKPKSDLYLSFVPTVNSKSVELPDNRQLINELRRLERRRGRAGKDIVDHRLGLFDDLANSVAGLAYLLTDGEAGRSQGGFNAAKHISPRALFPTTGVPVTIGLTLTQPTASVVGQMRGDRIEIYAAFVSDGLRQLLTEHLRPWLYGHARQVLNGSEQLCGVFSDDVDKQAQWSLLEVLEELIPGNWQPAMTPHEGRKEMVTKALTQAQTFTFEPSFQVTDEAAELIAPALSRPYDPRDRSVYASIANALSLMISAMEPGAKPEPAKKLGGVAQNIDARRISGTWQPRGSSAGRYR